MSLCIHIINRDSNDSETACVRGSSNGKDRRQAIKLAQSRRKLQSTATDCAMKLKGLVGMHICIGCDDHHHDEDEDDDHHDDYHHHAAGSSGGCSVSDTSEDVMYHNRSHQQQQGPAHRRPLTDSASLSSYCCVQRNFLSFLSNKL